MTRIDTRTDPPIGPPEPRPAHDRIVSDGLHPLIYKALAGLALWLVVSAWVGFDGQGYVSLLLVVVAGFFLIAAAIPYLLWRVWRNNSPGASTGDTPVTFSAWWSGEFDTWQGRVEGWDAAVEILLPLGAAAIGMTAIGLVFRFVAAGAS
jgi:hypothetical protein